MVQIDRQAKANIDRLDKRKQNVIRRVQSLPGRGALGDWVVCCESGGAGDVDVVYAWLEGRWLRVSESDVERD